MGKKKPLERPLYLRAKKETVETLTIELTSPLAYSRIKELEQLHILRVVKKIEKKKVPLSKKFAGILSKETGEKMQKYISKSRKEWERDI